jgi:hypothetical protein
MLIESADIQHAYMQWLNAEHFQKQTKVSELSTLSPSSIPQVLPKSKDHNCYLKQVNQHKTQT